MLDLTKHGQAVVRVSNLRRKHGKQILACSLNECRSVQGQQPRQRAMALTLGPQGNIKSFVDPAFTIEL